MLLRLLQFQVVTQKEAAIEYRKLPYLVFPTANRLQAVTAENTWEVF